MNFQSILEKTVFIFILNLFLTNTYAQSDCEVLLTSLKGKYEGDCKKGKADGKGKATGEKDVYEGEFKNGYPDGEGIYKYENGDYYEGSFTKGEMNGNGIFHYKKTNGDSIVKGQWVKNIYKNYDKTYQILAKTSAITKVSFKETKQEDGNRIIIISKPLSKSPQLTTLQSGPDPSNGKPGGRYRDKGYDLNNSKFYGVITPVSNFIITEGTFLNSFKRTTSKDAITEFQQTTFPFKATVYFNDDYLDFIINKPGTWTIDVTIAIEE